MEHMIEQQIIALDMETLTNGTKRLQLEDKVITFLNQLWDENCLKSSPRRTVEVNWEDNGMEVTAGELRAPTFYFMNETKFRQQVQQLLKSQIQWEQCLKNIIYQKFVTEWIKEPFYTMVLEKTCFMQLQIVKETLG